MGPTSTAQSYGLKPTGAFLTKGGRGGGGPFFLAPPPPPNRKEFS